MEFPPEPQVDGQEPQRHSGGAGKPNAPEKLRPRQPSRVNRGGFSVTVHHHDACGGGRHFVAGLKLRVPLACLWQLHLPRGQDIDLLLLQLPGGRLPHRLRHRQHIVLQARQAHGHQHPHQHQPPQGVLHPAGDGIAEHPTQHQQRQDQHGGCDENILHFPSPPAFSNMADSSAMSASVRARLSTMALIISPRLPP